MILQQITLDQGTFLNDVASSFKFVKDIMPIFMTAPVVYFVAFAVVGVAAGVALKFVPLKRR